MVAIVFTPIQPSSTALRLYFEPLSRRAEELFKVLYPDVAPIDEGMYAVHSDVIDVDDVARLVKLLAWLGRRDDARVWVSESPFLASLGESVLGALRVPFIDTAASTCYLPMMVVLDVSPFCRLGCPWCYAGREKRLPSYEDYYRSPWLGSELVEALASHVARAVGRVRSRALTLGLPEVRRVYVTLALGGGGDPLTLDLLELSALIDYVKDAAREIARVSKRATCFTALSTSDIHALSTNAECVKGLDEVSISLHYGEELRYLPMYRHLRPSEYGKLVATVIDEVIRVVNHVSLQVIVREASKDELCDLRAVLRSLFEELRVWQIENTSIFLLRYHEVPHFEGFKPPTLDTVVRFVEAIADEFPIRWRDEESPIQFDSCLTTMLTGIPIRWLKDELGLMHRVRLFSEEKRIEEVKGCPRGRYCQLAPWIQEENTPYGE